MTQPELYVVGLMLVLLACAYGMMRWNRYVVQSHKARDKGGRADA